MNWKQCLSGLGVVCLMSGCAYTELSKGGRKVTPLAAAPGADCKNYGTLVGTSGAFGAEEDKIAEAMNDVLNKAAEKRATHVFMQPPTFSAYQGTTASASVVAYAYNCPADKYGSLAEEEPAPAAKSYLSECPRQEGESVRQRALRCKQLASGTANE